MTQADALNRRHRAALAVRDRLKPVLSDVYRLTMPHRTQFDDSTYGPDEDELYDETGVVAVQEFASRMQAGLTPAFTTWAHYRPGHEIPIADRASVERDLSEIEAYAFEIIHGSNFASQSYEAYLEMAVSTGVLVVDEALEHPIVCAALPTPEIALELGVNGSVGAVFRKRVLHARLLPATYPDGEFSAKLGKLISSEPDRPVKVVDLLEAGWDRGMEFGSVTTFLPDHGEVIRDWRDRGYGAQPFMALRFGAAAGEAWGRGPAMGVLAGMKTIDQMIELMLQNAAMNLVGAYQVDDAGTFNPTNVEIAPGVLIPRSPGSRGLERLDAGSPNLRFADVVMGDQRNNIKRGLFNDMLSDPNRTPATAFEVSERMADLAYRSAAGFSRLHYDFIAPFHRRLLRILERRGLIEFPRYRGDDVQIRATSPLAQAQERQQVQSLMEYHQISAALMGPERAVTQYDPEVLLPWLRRQMSLQAGLFLPAEQAEENLMRAVEMSAAARAPAG